MTDLGRDALIEYACQYAASGLEVFPADSRSKAPIVSQYLATLNGEQVREWWTTYPTAMIGHRVARGFVLLDVDPKNNGMTTWAALKAEAGGIPETRVHFSGRQDGGGHVWFRYELGEHEHFAGHLLDAWAQERGYGSAIANGVRWTAGVDLLHHFHRYTLLPPSRHPDTGQPYRWRTAFDAPIADLPEWLRALIVVKREPVQTPRTPTDSGDGVIAWFNAQNAISTLLRGAGWTLVRGSGDDDGSLWRHPSATSDHSASVRDGRLYVHSSSTVFDPTEPGNPHGYDAFDIYATLEHRGSRSAAARAAGELRDGPRVEPRFSDFAQLRQPTDPPTGTADATDVPTYQSDVTHLQPINWPTFWTKDHTEQRFLVDPILPEGRSVAIWATHKTGKSLLTLDLAAALATGRPLLGRPNTNQPMDVIYLDMEMTEEDVFERLDSMGYGPEVDLSRLHYYLLPSLKPLDTRAGGDELVSLCDRDGARAVIIDTFARVVAGEENDADTYRDYYRYSAIRLKQVGVSTLRLDHGGKDAAKGQRGSSAKGDDVDVVWRLEPADLTTFVLKRQHSRVNWVPETVVLERREEPALAHVMGAKAWPAGTKDLADQLDAHGISPGLSGRAAAKALREAVGGPVPTRNLFPHAQRFRMERSEGLKGLFQP